MKTTKTAKTITAAELKSRGYVKTASGTWENPTAEKKMLADLNFKRQFAADTKKLAAIETRMRKFPKTSAEYKAAEKEFFAFFN
jgi:hypothetical protein